MRTKWEINNKIKVLLEIRNGFSQEDWLQALHGGFTGWENHIDIRFVCSRLDRLVLLPEAEIYFSTSLTPNILKLSKRLKWVHLASVGVEYLEGLSIPPHLIISTSSGISADYVGEHVLGLIIALDRRFALAIARQQEWRWNQVGILEGIRGLKGRTVGIVGLGHNGRAVSQVAKMLGMKVIGLDQNCDVLVPTADKIYITGELDHLLKNSDFVVLCVPSTRKTRGMIQRRELNIMRPDAYLINVARGDVINEIDLAEALRKGIIAGAALDVLSAEPPSRKHPLKGCPNLIITPHVAGNIYTVRREIQNRFVRNLKAYIAGDELEGVVH